MTEVTVAKKYIYIYHKMVEHCSNQKMAEQYSKKWLSSVYKKLLTRSQNDYGNYSKIIKWLSTVAK
jgi:hypothetical protein